MGLNGDALKAWLSRILEKLLEDSVVKLKIHGRISAETAAALSASSLRALVPFTMNVNVTRVESHAAFQKKPSTAETRTNQGKLK